MFLSVFDVFKIGVGPSSSHTMGPMTAAARFLDLLRGALEGRRATRLMATLHGSLAFTGKGHATDRAVALGLLGYLPADLDLDRAERELVALHESRMLRPRSLPPLAFDPAADIVFDYGPPLPAHANGLVFAALDVHGSIVLAETYYSIGGGFVITAAEREAPTVTASDLAQWPYPFDNAASMLAMSRETGLSVAGMKRENEIAVRPASEVEQGLARIWTVMNACIDRGLARDGELSGGLGV